MGALPIHALALLAATLLAPGCMSLEYDLGRVPVPVSAQPPAAGAATTHLTMRDKHVLWVHGLFGETTPDVAAMLALAVADGGHDGVASLRVTESAGFHEWLVTHLTLTLVRMKTVTIDAELLGGR